MAVGEGEAEVADALGASGIREETQPVDHPDPAMGRRFLRVCRHDHSADGTMERGAVGREVEIQLGGRVVQVAQKQEKEGHVLLLRDAKMLKELHVQPPLRRVGARIHSVGARLHDSFSSTGEQQHHETNIQKKWQLKMKQEREK